MYGENSYGKGPLPLNFLTAKIPYADLSFRRNFLTANFTTAKFPVTSEHLIDSRKKKTAKTLSYMNYFTGYRSVMNQKTIENGVELELLADQ